MSGLRRALWAIGALGFGCGAGYVALAASSTSPAVPGTLALLRLAVGWSFLYVGLFVWARRPENRMGMILTAVGMTWFLGGLVYSGDDLVHTLGLLCADLVAPVAYSLIAFPTGRVENRAERVVLGCAWAWATLGTLAATAATPVAAAGPRNLVSATDSAAAGDLARIGHGVVGALLAVAMVCLIVRRWTAGTVLQRREVEPVVATGSAAAAAFAASVMVTATNQPARVVEVVQMVGLLALVSLAFAFLLALVRARVVAGRAVTRLVQRLSAPVGSQDVRGLLAEALGDPSLDLAFPLRDGGLLVDAAGEPVTVPWHDTRRVTPVERDGRTVAVIVHDAALDRDGDLVRSAGAAAALALENARLDAELRARVAELSASRMRIVMAGDAERRRLERDLHDGAQQRLVSLAVCLRMARDRVGDDQQAGELIARAMEELQGALSELRELARGIHPAVLTDRGLGAALEGLAARAVLPVELEEVPEDRLPPPVEAAAYFVVCEALANVAKHSHATHARVRVGRAGSHARIEVRDDGIGGADPQRGSGLAGLRDRVAALEGRLEVLSPIGGGTTVAAEIPCA